ncbi:MAG: hypothetical protein ACR2QM_20655 [Longimicrobiales bacterium]
MIRLKHHKLTGAFFLIALGLVVAACGDDTPMEEEQEPQVATMRLTVGAQTVDVAEDGTVTGGPISIPVGMTAVSVEFLLASGQPEPLVTAAEFQANVASDDETTVTFTRTSAFAGMLDGVASGSAVLSFSLFHIEEAHEDFGPFPVSTTVQ